MEAPWDYNRTSKPRPNTPDNLCSQQKYFTPETANIRITSRNNSHQKEHPPEEIPETPEIGQPIIVAQPQPELLSQPIIAVKEHATEFKAPSVDQSQPSGSQITLKFGSVTLKPPVV